MRTIDGVEVKINKLPFPFSLFAKGMAWRGRVYLKDPLRASDRLIRHEMCHVRQQFPLWKYLAWWFRRGYKNHPFELEANKWESEYMGWENVTKESWRGYI